MDRLLDILAELHLLRMNFSATAARLGITVQEVESAHAYELGHGREIFLARADRVKRGAVRVLRPLSESELIANGRPPGHESSWPR